MDIMAIVNEKEEDIYKFDDTVTDIMADMSLENNIILSVYAPLVTTWTTQEPYILNI